MVSIYVRPTGKTSFITISKASASLPATWLTVMVKVTISPRDWEDGFTVFVILSTGSVIVMVTVPEETSEPAPQLMVALLSRVTPDWLAVILSTRTVSSVSK